MNLNYFYLYDRSYLQLEAEHDLILSFRAYMNNEVNILAFL